MRLLKLGVYPDTYLRTFYASRNDLKRQPYAQQHAALIDDCFGSSDFWTRELRMLGYETADTIANAVHLQKAWADENDFKFNGSNWIFQIASEQIRLFGPDVLLIADYSTFTADFLKNIRRLLPSLRLILGWCGAPYRERTVFREWDVVLSCVPEMVSDFRAQGIESYHVNHAFAPRILDVIDVNSSPTIDFGFVGSVLKQADFHVERERLLLQLMKSTTLEIWSDLRPSNTTGSYKSRISRKLREVLNVNPGIDTRILKRSHPAVFGIDMFQTLRQMRVVFNSHIDISPVSASNMRLFEATGVGSCMITDQKSNLSELFEPEKEVVTYSSAEDCSEKVRYLLDHDRERTAIAEAGQQRTLREHTFASRAAQIDEIIRRQLPSTCG